MTRKNIVVKLKTGKFDFTIVFGQVQSVFITITMHKTISDQFVLKKYSEQLTHFMVYGLYFFITSVFNTDLHQTRLKSKKLLQWTEAYLVFKARLYFCPAILDFKSKDIDFKLQCCRYGIRFWYRITSRTAIECKQNLFYIYRSSAKTLNWNSLLSYWYLIPFSDMATLLS